MRIWDIDPGYLARQQLLGEHRELHGLYNILTEGKQGYANHPETLRWVGFVDALCLRHRALASEMALRGYTDRSPLPDVAPASPWPVQYIDSPGAQFRLLAGKYAADGRSGRIPLPRNSQQLWAQHKYSLMAHDPAAYKEIGPQVAHGCYRHDDDALALRLVEALKQPPQSGHLYNALLHMWGYLEAIGKPPQSSGELLSIIRREAMLQQITYLQHSTALCELGLWI